MSNWERQSVKKAAFTESLAQWYLSLPNLPGERPLNDGHALALAEKMEKDMFLPENVRLAVVKVGNMTFRLNGQHTCMARTLVKLDGDWSARNKIEVAEYVCETADDAAELYAQFDWARSGRSYLDLARPYYTALNYAPASIREITLVAAALCFEKAGWNETARFAIRGEARYKLPPADAKTAQVLIDIIGDKTNRHMHREPVVCAILRTYRKDATGTRQFWPRVRDGEGLSKTDPEYVLRGFLTTVAVACGRGASRTRKAPFHEMFSRCIHAWNAWRAGTPTNLKYHATASLPVAR